MAERIRFHLDECVDGAIARGLRDRGIDATTTGEAGLLEATDEQHIQFAVDNQRVIFTHDEDFLAIHSRGTEHAGIAYCHQGARSIGDLVRSLVLIYECLTPEEMRNHVEFI